MPNNIGNNTSIPFCSSNCPTGKSTVARPKPAVCRLKANSGGNVNTVNTLLNTVSVTDSGTSPFASKVKILEELPPGEAAISIKPTHTYGSGRNHHTKPKASSGSICAASPTHTAFGCRINANHSPGRNESPKPNINSSKIGNTITMGFISVGNKRLHDNRRYRYRRCFQTGIV